MKNKKIIYIISLIIPSLIIMLAYCLKILHFNYSDDEMMNNIARGFFSGEPDEHIIFINVLFGYLTKALYQITKNINWYAIIYILIIIVLSYTILYVLKKNMKYVKAYSIFLFVLIFNVCWFTFTVIAYSATMAGILLFIDLINKKSEKRLDIIKFIIVSLLLCSGYILRNDAFISTLVMAIPLLLFVIFKKKNIKRIVITSFSIVILVFVCFLFNFNAYNSNFWKQFTQFNTARSSVIDYPVSSFDSNKDFYKSIDYSKNDLSCARSWCFGDKTVFNTKNYNKIVENTPFKTRYNINPLTYPKTLKERVSNKSTYIMVVIFILSLLIVGVIVTIFAKKKILYILQTLFGLGMIGYTFFINKPVARVVMPLAVVDVILLLFLFSFNKEKIGNYIIIKTLALIEILAFCMLSILFAYKTYDKAQYFKNEYVSRQKPIMKYINNHKDALFLCRGKLTWLYFKPAADICGNDTCINLMQTGDQDIYNNCYYKQLKKLNVSKQYYNHLLQNLLVRKHTYLIEDETNDDGTYELVKTFLEEHFSKKIHSNIIKSYFNNTVKIYKFNAVD